MVVHKGIGWSCTLGLEGEGHMSNPSADVLPSPYSKNLSTYLRDLLLRDFAPKYLWTYSCEVQFSRLRNSLEVVERQKNKKVEKWVYRKRNWFLVKRRMSRLQVRLLTSLLDTIILLVSWKKVGNGKGIKIRGSTLPQVSSTNQNLSLSDFFHVEIIQLCHLKWNANYVSFSHYFQRVCS